MAQLDPRADLVGNLVGGAYFAHPRFFGTDVEVYLYRLLAPTHAPRQLNRTNADRSGLAVAL